MSGCAKSDGSDRGAGVRVVRVQPDVPAIHRAFDYSVPDGLAEHVRVGTIVRVPLGGRRVRGWVLDDNVASPETDVSRLRDIAAVVSDGPPPDVVALCEWAAWRWAGPRATLLRAASPLNLVTPGRAARCRGRGVPDRHSRPRTCWSGDALIVWQPADDPNPVVATLTAPEGSTLVLDPDPVRAARLVALLLDEGREVVVIRSDHSAADLTAAWDRARAGACVVVGGRTAVWAPVPDLAHGDRRRRRRRGARRGTRAHVERPRRRTRTCPTRGATIRMITPAPTLDALSALGAPRALTPARSPRMSWPRVQVVDPRDDAPGQGSAHHRALADALRRVRDDGGRSRVRAQPPRAGTTPGVRAVHGARALRALWRDRGRARRRPCVSALRARAAQDLHALPRHEVPRAAPGREQGARRPRRTVAAGRGRGRRRRHRRDPGRRRRAHRHRGGAAPARRSSPTDPSAWWPSSSSTRSCSRLGCGRPSRRCGCWCGRPGCSGRVPTGECSCSRPGCPSTRWCWRRSTPTRYGSPTPNARAAAPSASRPSGGSPS